MKKAFAMVFALYLSVAFFPVAALASDINDSSAVTNSVNYTELLPVDVVQSPDSFEIRKIYELSPDIDPGRLPRGSFERSGYTYECTDILRDVVIGEESKTVTVTETAESEKNDTSSVLSLLPQYKQYSDENGFTGNLLLNTATIKSEASGYGTSSTQYTVSRSYPNLSDCDTQFVPKTIDDNGKTLQLQDIEWRTDNTYNVDYYEIANRYTAIAKYSGTKTSSYIKGYNITADYTGEVLRKGVTMIRYTVIFNGIESSASNPDIPPGKSGSTLWLPIMLSTMALLGCGACTYFTLKNRKETPLNEKDLNYDQPDSITANTGDSDTGDEECIPQTELPYIPD